MVGLLPLCAATVFEGSCWRSTRNSRSGSSGSSTLVPSCAPRSTTRERPVSPAAGWLRSWTKPSSAACWRRCSTRTSSSAPTASARCRATTPTIPTCSTPAARSTAFPTCRPSRTRGMFGGNSNWRGPIWMPVNALIIRALLQYYTYYGNDFTVECPTGSGRQMNLYQVAEEICAPAGEHLPEGPGRPAPGLRRRRQVPGRPALARLPAVLRVLPRRQRGRPGRQPPDRLDRHHRPDPAPVCHRDAGTAPGRRQGSLCRAVSPAGGRVPVPPAARVTGLPGHVRARLTCSTQFLESMTELPILARFAIALVVILTLPPLCRRVHLPAVVGFLLAGVLFGPSGLHVAPKNAEVAHFFSELGKLLLMFFAGLEIDLTQFQRVRNRSLAFGDCVVCHAPGLRCRAGAAVWLRLALGPADRVGVRVPHAARLSDCPADEAGPQ